jgi:hypothetical protein
VGDKEISNDRVGAAVVFAGADGDLSVDGDLSHGPRMGRAETALSGMVVSAQDACIHTMSSSLHKVLAYRVVSSLSDDP